MDSPKKKKTRKDKSSASKQPTKIKNDDESSFAKRLKTEKTFEEDLQAKKRKNFITACEIVSYKAYYNQHSRFQLIYSPTCAKNISCKHHDNKMIPNIKQMPFFAEECFNIEIKTNMWREALEVCKLCITSEQYLSANVLKDVIEIMLNAHRDNDYNTEYLISKCQQIFELNLSYHPPCLMKSLRKCYKNFLTSPMNPKSSTFSNRSQFECDKGIVKYCMNRLEYEMSQDSCDGPLFNKDEHIPEEMVDSVKGLHWQQEQFEIYELLERTERISRLFAILDSIIELLQFDLVIWNTRYTNNLGSHIMRSHKPLMAYLLWSNNVLYTGTVNMNCRQILRIFIYVIQLQYPEKYIRIMTIWLNTMIETFYICENNSNMDYPNTGKYCSVFAKEFYKLIAGLPQDVRIKVLERIKPDYMQYLMGILHLKVLLATPVEDPISALIGFIKTSQWKQFPESNIKIISSRRSKHSITNVKDIFDNPIFKCAKLNENIPNKPTELKFGKLSKDDASHEESIVTLNQVVHTFYVTLSAYLDAFSVQEMQEALDTLNEKLLKGETTDDNTLPLFCSYAVTEQFVKKYRSIYQTLKELMILIQDKRNSGELPDTFNIFRKIGLQLT